MPGAARACRRGCCAAAAAPRGRARRCSAATGAAIARATGGGEQGAVAPVGNGVAAIDPRGERDRAFIETATAPSNVAVGEGAVWVLNTETGPSRASTRRRRPSRDGSSRPASERHRGRRGGLWVGLGGGESANYTLRVARIDPRTSKVTHTVKLPDRTGNGAIATFNEGHSDIAVGAGAVWTHNPDHTLSRLDPKTGKLVATIDVETDGIAADAHAVWVVNGPVVTRIDPRTNRVAQRFRLATEDTQQVAAVASRNRWATRFVRGSILLTSAPLTTHTASAGGDPSCLDVDRRLPAARSWDRAARAFCRGCAPRPRGAGGDVVWPQLNVASASLPPVRHLLLHG